MTNLYYQYTNIELFDYMLKKYIQNYTLAAKDPKQLESGGL